MLQFIQMLAEQGVSAVIEPERKEDGVYVHMTFLRGHEKLATYTMRVWSYTRFLSDKVLLKDLVKCITDAS